MKANTIMANLFDIQSNEGCGEISEVLIVDEEPTESLKDLILEFWYKQVFMFYCVCCDLAEARTRSIYCKTRFLLDRFFSGGGGNSSYCFCSRTKPRA